jgi:hypothetical protein
MSSPYETVVREKWATQTRTLVDGHPLDMKELVDVVLGAWNSIFESTFGTKGYRIGVDIFPKPQVMGFLLHELVALDLAARHPDIWRGEKSGDDKDLVYIPDGSFSVEIKTSSDKAHIYGNRSYAQESSSVKKSKTGYYLAINFEKFTKTNNKPRITMIRFGWIDHADWQGQAAATGQQARLDPAVEGVKLVVLYRP